MMKNSRQQRILELLKQHGEVKTLELSQMIDVSSVTLRRDLDEMSREGLIIRTHGGAVFKSSETTEPPYSKRLQEHGAAKRRIAEAAVSLLSEVSSVFLDSGTTTYEMACLFSEDTARTAITNAINVATALIKVPFLSVFLIGGDLQGNSLSTRGTDAENQLHNFRVDVAFLGYNAISSAGCVLIGSTAELGIKAQIRKIARRIYLLADSSKFDGHSLVSYANVIDFDGIITDGSVSEEVQKNMQRLGAHLIIAD